MRNVFIYVYHVNTEETARIGADFISGFLIVSVSTCQRVLKMNEKPFRTNFVLGIGKCE